MAVLPPDRPTPVDPAVDLPPGAPDFGWLASSAGAQALRAARIERPQALHDLEARVSHDLSCLNYPPANWVPERIGPDGVPMTDVLVAGAGMCGQTVAYALRREGVLRQRVIDARPEGLEGPWATHARMEILRSPKHLTGPELGVPSMSFRAWYEARFGEQAWSALHKVWRLDWRDYLLWVRRQVGVQVDNGWRLSRVEPAEGGLRLQLDGPERTQWLTVRKLVLALGREGSGAARLPHFPSLQADSEATRACVFHSSDPVPFANLAGARVGVLGAGASAFDNAASALEHGAASVSLFVRRAAMPQVNKSKWTSFAGFFRGYPALDDAQRLALYRHVFEEQVPPPFESVLRCQRHAGFELRMGEPWLDVQVDAGRARARPQVRVVTPTGIHPFDAVILGTGFDVDLPDRPELQALAAHVLTWSDRTVQAGDRTSELDTELGRFPYLGEAFELTARTGTPDGVADALARIHLFNWGSTLSHGAVAGDIPGLAFGASRLAAALARDLFVEDAAQHRARLLAHNERELRYTTLWDGAPGEGPRLG